MTLINPDEDLASTQELLASVIETIRTLRLRFGQVHPCLGDGTLAAAARKHALAIEPALDDMDYCACLELVLLQLMARRM